MNLKKHLSRNLYNIFIGVGLLWIGVVFYYFLNQQILPYTNRFDDEGYYLRDSITIWSKLKEFGFFKVLNEYLKQNLSFFYFEPGPNTNLGYLASLVMWVFGPGRGAALSLNLFGLLLTLLVTIKTFKDLKIENELKLIPLVFVFYSSFCFNGAGDLFDFRLDFFGSCLYGVSICGLISIMSNKSINKLKCFVYLFPIFLSSIFRFILIIYLLLPILYFSFSIIKNKSHCYRNVFLSLASISTLVLLNAIWGFNFLKNYYWLQQQSSLEKIFRKQYFSDISSLGYILYYPKTFISNYVGVGFTFSLVLFIVCLFYKFRKRILIPHNRCQINREIVVLIFFSLISPVLILSLNYVRTAQVIGVLVIPTCILLVLAIKSMDLVEQGIRVRKYIIWTAFVLGLIVWPIQLFKKRKVDLSDITKIQIVFETAFNYFVKNSNEKPIIAFLDSLADFDHNTFTIWAAEKKNGILLLPEMVISRLPYNLTQEKILNELKNATYFIIPKEWSHLKQSKWLVFHDVFNSQKPILSWLEKNTYCGGSFKWKGVEYYTCFK